MRRQARRCGNLARRFALAGAVLLAPIAAMAGPLLGGGLSGLPTGPLIGGVTGTVGRTTGNLRSDLDSTLDSVRRDMAGRPLVPRALERDPFGARIVRGEIVAVAPSEQALARLKRLNFEILRRDELSGLGLASVVLRAPGDMSVSEALDSARKADPGGVYDYDHIYDPSGEGGSKVTSTDTPPQDVSTRDIRIGMIDGGIARRHSAFRDARLVTRNVVAADSAPATAHGTAIASLFVGEDDDFHGYIPGATLYAADVFGGAATGGAADDIVRALDWLAANRIAVVNVSLAGPPNKLLERAVHLFLARGHVLVAAVGNQGPAGPLAYPAAYDGVVGVTSVDADHHLQPDAGRSDVSFAALGVDVRAANPEHGYTKYTGTSFAAPCVAARFALLLAEPDPHGAMRARDLLAHSALALGPAGRDRSYGYGFLDVPAVTSMALSGR